MAFVLDNSVATRWILETERAADQAYAENVLRSLPHNTALVPNLWHLEASNVLLSAERRKLLEYGEVEAFVNRLECLPIEVDRLTDHQAFSRTTPLARAYKLSSYDAAYLELAIRMGLPLASLDKSLIKVAKKANVDVYQPAFPYSSA